MDRTTRLWSRREVLAAAGATSVVLCVPSVRSFASDPVSEVDHLIWAAADLDEGIALIEKMTGVRAIVGGVHPGGGTRNALLSLGKRCYLEILSVDPDQPEAGGDTLAFLRNLTQPRFVGWAAGTKNIDAVAKKIRETQFEVRGPTAGSRAKPDGTILEWKTLGIVGQDRTVVPFVIEWDKDTVHPAVDSPGDCTLHELELVHPSPEKTNPVLSAMGLTLRAEAGPIPGITATLDTPKGRVELT